MSLRPDVSHGLQLDALLIQRSKRQPEPKRIREADRDSANCPRSACLRQHYVGLHTNVSAIGACNRASSAAIERCRRRPTAQRDDLTRVEMRSDQCGLHCVVSILRRGLRRAARHAIRSSARACAVLRCPRDGSISSEGLSEPENSEQHREHQGQHRGGFGNLGAALTTGQTSEHGSCGIHPKPQLPVSRESHTAPW